MLPAVLLLTSTLSIDTPIDCDVTANPLVLPTSGGSLGAKKQKLDTFNEESDADAETFDDEDKENASQNALRQPTGTRALGSQDRLGADQDEDEEDWEEVAKRIHDANGDHYEVLGVSREDVTDEIIHDAHDRIEAGLGHLPSHLREPGCLAQIKQALADALDALHSEEARSQYDRELEVYMHNFVKSRVSTLKFHEIS